MVKLKTKYQSLVLIGYSLIIFYVIAKGIFIKFVHPRMIPYTLACGVFILILSVIDIFKPAKDSKLHISNAIYIIPLLFIFFTNNGQFSNNMLNNKSTNVGINKNQISAKQDNNNQNSASNQNTVENTTDQNQTVENTNSNDNTYQNDDESSDIYTGAKANGSDFYFDDKNYLNNLLIINDEVDKYVGKTVSFDGFIYRDDTMTSSQFFVGRLGIWCCISDASLSGFLCDLKDNQMYKDDEWYRVEGKLDKIELTDPYDESSTYISPYVHVTKMTKIDKPEVEYVYPS